jgi:hypothetical protein
MVIVPMRCVASGFWAIVSVAVPGPTVTGLLVTDIQLELLAAVQAQFAAVVTVTFPLSPAARADLVSGTTL